MKESATARRGAEFLDERVPEWAEMIDLDKFNLESAYQCVVGQIEARLHPRSRYPKYERFDRGLHSLGLDRERARQFGFYGMDSGNVGRTWRQLIAKRQAA